MKWLACLVIPALALASGISTTGGCGSSDEEDGAGASASTAPGAGGSAAEGGGIGSGGGAPGCDPPCEAPQTCSVVGDCIDEGTCKADGDCGAGTVCDEATEQCVPGGECGGQEAKIEAVPPNLLIVLDRSCSMEDVVGSQTKWEIAVAALNAMTTTFVDQIRFGLILFPDTIAPQCAQTEYPVPVAAGTEMAIQALLTSALATGDLYYPSGPCVTNIDTAVEQAAAEPALADPDRDSFVLLITDGKQAGCSAAGGDAGTLQIIGDMFAAGVGTFVLGFGSGVDAAQMNQFAVAGGVPYNDPTTKYYQAEDQTSLDAVLTNIASQTIGCVFDLDEVPPNADEVFVFFDNTESIAKDTTHMEGWDYDPSTNQVTFYGDACAKLKAGEVTDVDIVFGCNVPTPQ